MGGFVTLLGVCALIGATRTDHPVRPSAKAIVASAKIPEPDPVIAEVSRDQEFQAEYPVTSSAEAAVRLLAIHKGDDFPLTNPNGRSQLLWQDAQLAEAQLAPFLASTITPDGKTHPQPFVVTQQKRIEAARYDARRMATAEAIAYAIHQERGAWSPPGQVIASRNIRIEAHGDCLAVTAPLLDEPETICGEAARVVRAAISEERG